MKHGENGKMRENETCAFILFSLRVVYSPPPLIFFLVAGRLTFNTDLSNLFWHYFLCEFLVLAVSELQWLVSNTSGRKINQIRRIKFSLLDSLVPLPLSGRNQSKDVLV